MSDLIDSSSSEDSEDGVEEVTDIRLPLPAATRDPRGPPRAPPPLPPPPTERKRTSRKKSTDSSTPALRGVTKKASSPTPRSCSGSPRVSVIASLPDMMILKISFATS